MPGDGTVNSPTSSTQVVSPALRKKLQQCYEHGTKLMQQESYDFDYAHSMLVECIVKDPGNLTYVEAFLQNLQRKFKNNKRGSLLAFGGKGGLKKAVAKKDWDEVLRLGPELLKSNPWDVTVLRGMAEACAASGFTDVELRLLKNALEANPKDAEVNKHCAQSLARIGQFDQAIMCWQRVDEVRKGDAEAQEMISQLQIAKTFGRVEGRRGGAGKGSPAETKAEPAVAHEPEAARREIKLTPRQELEQAISNNPTDLESYLQLAQLHISEDRLGEASHVLTRALGASGNQIKIQERLEDVEILRKKQQLAIAEKRAESEPEAAHEELVGQLREDLNRIELEVYDRRAQRYPANLELKFQLGLRLKRVGNWREAARCFEQAQKSPERRAGAALEMGECLQRLKQYEKAIQQYRVAAAEPAADRSEIRKLALYRLALLSEGLKNLEDAERSLAELTSQDPDYKDAATRLDKIRAVRHKQA